MWTAHASELFGCGKPAPTKIAGAPVQPVVRNRPHEPRRRVPVPLGHPAPQGDRVPRPNTADETPILPKGRARERARRHLQREQGLAPVLIECCRRIGVFSADDRVNAVFACRDRNCGNTGTELIETRANRPFRGMARESRKAMGGFRIAQQTDPTPHFRSSGTSQRASGTMRCCTVRRRTGTPRWGPFSPATCRCCWRA